MSEFRLLLQIAFRNLFSSFLNIVIGTIILVGTFVFVVGGSLIDGIDTAMSRSITASCAGDIQVYSDSSKEEISLFSNWGYPDITTLPDFSKLKEPLLAIDNVKTVIPMGVSGATVNFGNTVDLVLEKLRRALNARIAGDRSPDLAAKIESLKSHVRQMVNVIQGDFKKFTTLASQEAIDKDAEVSLQRASSPGFWEGFEKAPLDNLEFLENKIAALVPDADMIFLSYVGTDLEAFKGSFDRMEIVDGGPVPPGQRGFLLSKYIYENQFKLKTAHRLDKILEAINDEGQTIAKNPDLQLMVKQNRTQTREILLQMDPLSAKTTLRALGTFLHSDKTELGPLLEEFFDTNDANFKERYRFFYDQIAPQVELYRLRPGDALTVKAYTKTGFIQSANLKVYGTFQFKGLEKSGLAGSVNLMDLMSFRDLYGFVTPDKVAEVKELEASAGAKFVDRDQAESQLFGGTSSVTSTQSKRIDDKLELSSAKLNVQKNDLLSRVYSKEEIEKGAILNAAILLKDPKAMTRTMRDISEASKKGGWDLRVVSWQKAAGNLGQFVFVAKAALYFAVFIIFIVALVIINNAVMMATLQRIREIGTMRAIGAQRTFVLSLVLVETLFLGVAFGSVGTLLGAAAVRWMGHVGLPAKNDFLYFFFSGPRLYVSLSVGSLIGAFVIICIVTSFSALYPALVATRISPLQAMQTED